MSSHGMDDLADWRCDLNVLAYDALASHFDSERKAALHDLRVYFENPVGIGEHPDVLEEMRTKLEIIANADDCLNVLDQYKDVLIPE